MGPVVLITIGVLFLLDQLGHSHWMDFGSTWPALLIVIGLIMFLQHNASAEGHVPRDYPGMVHRAGRGNRCLLALRVSAATADRNAAAGSSGRLHHDGCELARILTIRRCTMASQNTYPPPPPPPPPPQYQYPAPPPYRYRRSIAGPLVLIVIGLLFLLRNFGIRFPIWHFFGRWWPLLLILLGRDSALIEHSLAAHGLPPRRPGSRSSLLLVLIVAVGLSAHYSSDIDWGGVRNQIQMDDDLGGIFGTAFTFDDTVQQAFPAHGNLRVVCDHGSLNIAPADDNTLRVVVHKKVYAQNQNDANKYNDGHQATDHGDAEIPWC